MRDRIEPSQPTEWPQPTQWPQHMGWPQPTQWPQPMGLPVALAPQTAETPRQEQGVCVLTDRRRVVQMSRRPPAWWRSGASESVRRCGFRYCDPRSDPSPSGARAAPELCILTSRMRRWIGSQMFDFRRSRTWAGTWRRQGGGGRGRSDGRDVAAAGTSWRQGRGGSQATRQGCDGGVAGAALGPTLAQDWPPSTDRPGLTAHS